MDGFTDMTSVTPPPPSSSPHPTSELEDEEILWNEIDPDLPALETIIQQHFGQACKLEESFELGSYARTFLYRLTNGKSLVARVILPVRDYIKTECEVSSMCFIRGEIPPVSDTSVD